MSSTSTEYEFTSSLEKDGNIYLTKDRQYLYYNDLQGGNYNANSSEVKFELVSLANTNQFVNFAESFLMIPLELKVAGGLNASPENAFAMSLKNGYQQIIDSLLITVNDNPVNQPCQGSNLEQTFRMYQMSADDRKTLGDIMNFYLDTGDSIRYVPSQAYGGGTPQLNSISATGVATFNVNISVVKGQQFVHNNITYTILATVSGVTKCTVTPSPGAAINTINANIAGFITPSSLCPSGLGELNNVISKSTLFNPKEGYQAVNGVVNEGRFHRQLSTSYDPTTV